ncbi:hypothetical protein ACFQ48_20060 [Hymenobacter caeli]|uniref:Membrane protein n=1 Tax=Hymenobacter caeli TaxID=2735894 RepID=A0ABX2FYA8_9BACT|nr:gliding motility protein GldL [Hymenobacter caeli]NRT21259.1 putative membrane protein [Hymenobacter caeli]
MKAKYSLVLFALGLGFDFVGALFKVMHWAGADLLLVAGLTFKIVGGLLFLYKLLRHPRVREFLNS